LLLADRYHIVGSADFQDVARKLTGTIAAQCLLRKDRALDACLVTL
jgi:hypothetical protein